MGRVRPRRARCGARARCDKKTKTAACFLARVDAKGRTAYIGLERVNYLIQQLDDYRTGYAHATLPLPR